MSIPSACTSPAAWHYAVARCAARTASARYQRKAAKQCQADALRISWQSKGTDRQAVRKVRQLLQARLDIVDPAEACQAAGIWQEPAKPAARPRRLLLLACSATKDKAPGLLPAADRYAPGAYWQLLHQLPRDEWPLVVVLSAAHGFIAGDQAIADYDQRMTPARAAELAAEPGQLQRLAELVAGADIAEAFAAGGADYRGLMRSALAAAGLDHVATFASGRGIGDHRSQLKAWLQAGRA